MEIKCPECGQYYRDSFNECPSCLSTKKAVDPDPPRDPAPLKKKCRYCAMNIPKEASICPFCRKQQGTSLAMGCLSIVALLGGLFIISAIISTITTPSVDIAGADSIDAYLAATRFVRGTLRNPHTANFCAHISSDIKKLTPDTCSVTSYVDAKNDFGGEIRTHFTVTMRHMRGKEWELLDIDTRRE